MRRRGWKHAIECISVDAILTKTDAGPRVMLQPTPSLSAIRPATYCLGIADAKELAIQLFAFVETVEAAKPPKVQAP